MKKISDFINIIIILMLAGLLILLFSPMLAPQIIINHSLNSLELDKQYETDFIINLSSSDTNLMDDIYVFNQYQVDNELQEAYQNTKLNLGKEMFEWQTLYKFNTLQTRTPFDGRSIEFDNFSLYKIEKPDSHKIFLYDFISTNLNNFEIIDKKYTLDPYETGNFLDKIRINYTLKTTNENTDLFVAFLNHLQSNSGFNSFFIMNKQIENKLLLKNEMDSLLNLLTLIEENELTNEILIDFSISTKGIELLEVNFDFDYVVNNKPIPMSFYTSQSIKYLNDIDITENVYFTSLTSIDNLAPDTGNTNNNSNNIEKTETVIVNDPVDGDIEVPIISFNN